ncbi:MAG: hypothetical protein AB1646_19400 [Thermodesulfobacteriota bacterium]
MNRGALFTASDLAVIDRAVPVAEGLTRTFFGLADNEWKRNPYGIFTLGQVRGDLYQEGVFARLVRYDRRSRIPDGKGPGQKFGIVLQDPNILSALFRSHRHDLWTLVLFVLTHELVHIVRFRRFGVDFDASDRELVQEERLVHDITREILAGVANTDFVLGLYESQFGP